MSSSSPPWKRLHPVQLNDQFGDGLGIRSLTFVEESKKLFPKPKPQRVAEDIHELLDNLSAEDDGHFFYRGQTRDYPALIPSIYRKAVVSGTEDDPLVQVDPTAFHNSLSTRDRARLEMLNHLMRHYGASLGNILAQQYGMGLEMLDVTSHPGIAAFFATHRWPIYAPYDVSRAKEPDLGVIYRFRRPPEPASLTAMDQIYQCAFKRIAPFGDTPFAVFRKVNELGADEVKALRAALDQDGGAIQAEVRTMPMAVGHRFFVEKAQAHLKRPVITQAELQNTRWGRQQGGCIRTGSRWVASVSAKLGVAEFENAMLLHPPIAIGEELIAIENMNRLPGVDVFPFRHREGVGVDIDREYLWPFPEQDFLYRELGGLCRVFAGEYLEKAGAVVDDMEKGLLDPGFEDPVSTP